MCYRLSILEQLRKYPIIIQFELTDQQNYIAWFHEIPDLIIETSDLHLITKEMYDLLDEYANDYLREFHKYHQSTNRKDHLPYVLATKLLSKTELTRSFELITTDESTFQSKLIQFIQGLPPSMHDSGIMEQIQQFYKATTRKSEPMLIPRLEYDEQELINCIQRLQAQILD